MTVCEGLNPFAMKAAEASAAALIYGTYNIFWYGIAANRLDENVEAYDATNQALRSAASALQAAKTAKP